MEWIGADVCFAAEDVGTRDEGPALCPGIVAFLPPPTRFSFLFLFGATDDAVSSKQKALFACLCSINLTDFICPFHPISLSLFIHLCTKGDFSLLLLFQLFFFFFCNKGRGRGLVHIYGLSKY